MTDETANLILKELDALHDDLRAEVREITACVHRLEFSVAEFRREVARIGELIAHRWTVLDARAAHLDRLESRVDRPGTTDSTT